MGKTVEQALMEVMEEEELAALRKQQVSGARDTEECVCVELEDFVVVMM